MKRLAILLSLGTMLAAGAELSGVHSVYVMSMGHGLDQYMTNRLTSDHVFQVVTDAKLADAVFTDRVGQAFEAQLQSLLPPPPAPPKPEVKDAKPAEDKPAPLLTETVNKLDNPANNSNFARSKGNVFLVDVKSRQVLWSVYEPPKDMTSRELDHTAAEIVNRLKKDMGIGGKK